MWLMSRWDSHSVQGPARGDVPTTVACDPLTARSSPTAYLVAKRVAYVPTYITLCTVASCGASRSLGTDQGSARAERVQGAAAAASTRHRGPDQGGGTRGTSAYRQPGSARRWAVASKRTVVRRRSMMRQMRRKETCGAYCSSGKGSLKRWEKRCSCCTLGSRRHAPLAVLDPMSA